MEIMHLFRAGIILTQAKQIVDINLDYNVCLSNEAKKRISQIEQSNESTSHIIVYIDVRKKQQIRKHHNKCQKIQNMTINKA